MNQPTPPTLSSELPALTDAGDALARLQLQLDRLKGARTQLEAQERQHQRQRDALAERERELKHLQAQADARASAMARQASDQERLQADLSARETRLEAQQARLQAREVALAHAERVIAARESELTAAHRNLETREAELDCIRERLVLLKDALQTIAVQEAGNQSAAEVIGFSPREQVREEEDPGRVAELQTQVSQLASERDSLQHELQHLKMRLNEAGLEIEWAPPQNSRTGRRRSR